MNMFQMFNHMKIQQLQQNLEQAQQQENLFKTQMEVSTVSRLFSPSYKYYVYIRDEQLVILKLS